MGVIFGGGGGSVFGSSGAGGLLNKLTAGAATVFFLTSMTFTYVSTQQHVSPKESIVLDMPVTAAPVAPVPPIVDEQSAPADTQPKVESEAQPETQPQTQDAQ